MTEPTKEEVEIEIDSDVKAAMEVIIKRTGLTWEYILHTAALNFLKENDPQTYLNFVDILHKEVVITTTNRREKENAIK